MGLGRTLLGAFGAEGRLLGLGVGGVFRGVLCARMGWGGGKVREW